MLQHLLVERLSRFPHFDIRRRLTFLLQYSHTRLAFATLPTTTTTTAAAAANDVRIADRLPVFEISVPRGVVFETQMIRQVLAPSVAGRAQVALVPFFGFSGLGGS